VKIVAVGGGLAYGSLGMTHHATEDIAVMRALPNMLVVAPNDPIEAALATEAVAGHDGPCYLRLGRQGEARVHTSAIDFRLGEAITVLDGEDLTLIVTGGLLASALDAAAALARKGIAARVLSMHTVKPLDRRAVLAAAKETRAVFTIEEHSIVGGLGGAVAELLMEECEQPVRFRRIGLANKFSTKVGDQNYLREQYGLDVDGILGAVEKAWQSTPRAVLKVGANNFQRS
jgi:transketolase